MYLSLVHRPYFKNNSILNQESYKTGVISQYVLTFYFFLLVGYLMSLSVPYRDYIVLMTE
jgi:hypothetical protein